MAAIPRLLLAAGRLAVKYVVVPIAVTAATAFVLGGLVERVRHQKRADGMRVQDMQAHLDA